MTPLFNKIQHWLISFSMLFITASGVAQNLVDDATERAALLAIYNSMDGANWSNNRWRLTQINSYPDSVPPGVLESNGDIYSVNLASRNLTGELPAALSDLQELKSLSLQGNPGISGTLPDLSSLTKLNYLNLSSISINGPMPSWICSLTSLEQLYLVNAKLTSIPPAINQLTKLTELFLDQNNFSSALAIPDSFNQLDKLQRLSMQICNLVPGAISQGFNGLSSLVYLNLNSNPSFINSGNEFPDVLNNLPVLQTLHLQSNAIHRFPMSFTALHALLYLNLSYNNYANESQLSEVVNTIKDCPSLQTLALQGCGIVALPSNFDDLSTVRQLYLDYNTSLDVNACEELADMSSLRDLHISNCGLESLPPSLVNSESLRALYASNNNLQPLPEAILKNIPNLEFLELNYNGLTTLPDWFGTSEMKSIKTLIMNHNNISFPLPENFRLLSNLEILEMAYNNMDGDLPPFFSTLINIRRLDLSYNAIDNLTDLTPLKYLENVNVEHNNLSGKVPTYLSQATSDKKAVNISFNHYDAVEQGVHFNETNFSCTVSFGNNQFTFEDMIHLRPAWGNYTYTPQNVIVDVERDIKGFIEGRTWLIAEVDTAAAIGARFQWFRQDGSAGPLPASPTFQARRTVTPITLADQYRKFYYQITHPLFPGLALRSNLQRVVITCDEVPQQLAFESRRYLCAMNFIPQIVYPEGCYTKSYAWNFGDGNSSIEKSPFHAYNADGTYDVTMSIRYSCGICIRDTTFTRPVTYSLAEDLLRDSLIEISTNVFQQVIASSATTFSDAWPLSHNVPANENGFQSGTEGIWRNEGIYVYKVARNQSSPPSVSKDGTYTLEQFNWEHADLDAIPHWINSNTITQQSAYSYELENRDVLGNYSAAVYDYGGHLLSANGVNMRNSEMAFTSFEYLNQDVNADIDSRATGNWIFGNKSVPAYYDYEVLTGLGNMAIVKASLKELERVNRVDVRSIGSFAFGIFRYPRYNHIYNNEIICRLEYPNNPEWSMIVLRKAPNPAIWTGIIRAHNTVEPSVSPVLGTQVAHSGERSLYITSDKTFRQELLRLDSGKRYMINAWVSVNNPHVSTPKLSDGLGISVVFYDANGAVKNTTLIEPSGRIIEGWQQVRGAFVCPDKALILGLTFHSGSTGSAWYDDLRLHPEEGNMKSYVYDIRDYRLHAILDEENFGSFFYYDDEGNLYLTKRETEEGIKTISENISYMVERPNPSAQH